MVAKFNLQFHFHAYITGVFGWPFIIQYRRQCILLMFINPVILKNNNNNNNIAFLCLFGRFKQIVNLTPCSNFFPNSFLRAFIILYRINSIVAYF